MGNIVLALVSFVLGGLVSWGVAKYYYERSNEDLIARHAVMAMLPKCPVRNTREFDERIEAFRAALERAKQDGRGVPVVREDCSIAVDWSIELGDRIQVSGG